MTGTTNGGTTVGKRGRLCCNSDAPAFIPRILSLIGLIGKERFALRAVKLLIWSLSLVMQLALPMAIPNLTFTNCLCPCELRPTRLVSDLRHSVESHVPVVAPEWSLGLSTGLFPDTYVDPSIAPNTQFQRLSTPT